METPCRTIDWTQTLSRSGIHISRCLSFLRLKSGNSRMDKLRARKLLGSSQREKVLFPRFKAFGCLQIATTRDKKGQATEIVLKQVIARAVCMTATSNMTRKLESAIFVPPNAVVELLCV